MEYAVEFLMITDEKKKYFGLLSAVWIPFLLLTLFPSAKPAAQTIPDSLLNKLTGKWTMTGTVGKKPVQYTAQGTWVLQNQFFVLHMNDLTDSPPYEASLFIGVDTAKKEYVAHWLDRFGGAGARVVGFGPRPSSSSNTIEIDFPYENKFHDVFTYLPSQQEWTLLIEYQKPDSSWNEFARYVITMQKEKGKTRR